jgi:hypothetical protein
MYSVQNRSEENMARLLFRNLYPLYEWLFSIAWCAISTATAFVAFRNQNIDADPSAAAVAVIFSLIGAFFLIKFVQVPIISIWDDGGDDWLIVRRWLWKVETIRVNRLKLPMPAMEEESDNEGGKIYRCLPRTSAGSVEFSRYRRREPAQLTCDKMRMALSGGQG